MSHAHGQLSTKLHKPFGPMGYNAQKGENTIMTDRKTSFSRGVGAAFIEQAGLSPTQALSTAIATGNSGFANAVRKEITGRAYDNALNPPLKIMTPEQIEALKKEGDLVRAARAAERAAGREEAIARHPQYGEYLARIERQREQAGQADKGTGGRG